MLQLLLLVDQQASRPVLNLAALHHARHLSQQQAQLDDLRRLLVQWCHLLPSTHRQGERENKQASTCFFISRRCFA